MRQRSVCVIYVWSVCTELAYDCYNIIDVSDVCVRSFAHIVLLLLLYESAHPHDVCRELMRK